MNKTINYGTAILCLWAFFSSYGQNTNLKTETLKQQLKDILQSKNERRSQPTLLRLSVLQEDDMDLEVLKHQSFPHQECYYGKIANTSGSSFRMAFEADTLTGIILDRTSKRGYKVYSDNDGQVIVVSTNINNIICTEYEVSAAPLAVDAVPPATSTVYKLQSNPASKSVAYLDFDGETVSGTEWVDGGTINALPGNFTEANIQDIFNLVSEDFSAFNVNVTTDLSVYNAATLTSRMKCIFTPTNTASPGAGGVAYIGSFTWGDNTPCWVFNSSVKSAGEAASHEIGHTLNLKHDGRTSPQEEYFAGHANWGPIMGATYSRPVVHWSTGEYSNANNLQDDISIITSRNGFTFKTDDHGNSTALASNITLEASGALAASNKGVIEKRTDLDLFKFTSVGGTININATPAVGYPNLDIKLDLLDALGNVVASNNSTTSLSAALSYTIGPGTFYISIDGVGTNDPKTNGYSDYSSIGVYNLTGTIPTVAPDNLLPNVSLTAPTGGFVYEAPASILIKATATDIDGNISKVEFYNGTTKIGEDLTAPYEYTWNNVAIGNYNITAKAFDNESGSSTSSVTAITVKKANCKIAATPVVRDYIIGTEGSYNNGGRTRNLAFDNDSTTYFDSPNTSGSWVGLDLNGVYKITGIRYYPRTSYGSRMNGGKFQGSNTPDFSSGVVDLASISSTPAVEWNCITISNTNSFKFVRYLSPNNSQGNVAEVEFYGTKVTNQDPTVKITSPANLASAIIPATFSIKTTASDPDGSIIKVELYNGTTKIGEDLSSPYEFNIASDTSKKWTLIARAIDNLGEYTLSDTIWVFAKRPTCQINGNIVKTFTIIGTAGSFNSLGNTRDKAFDKDSTTFFDSPSASNNWVGMDLGSTKNIVGVRFFPRFNAGDRMLNGRFQVATNASFTQGVVTIDTIDKVYDSEWNCITFAKTYANRYVRYIGPSNGYCNIAELQVLLQNTAPIVSFNNSATAYNSAPAQILLNISASDPDGTIKTLELYQDNVFLTNLQLTNGSANYTHAVQNDGTYTYTLKATDDGNSSTISNALVVQVNSITGLTEQISTDLDFNISPNPAKNSISIQSKEEIINLQLVDTQGKILLFTEDISKELKLPENIASGLHMLIITQKDGQIKTAKIVIHP